MKIDKTRLRKSTSEVPPECQALIDRLRNCSRTELLDELSKISTWTFGKCELYHWIGVLDYFDVILEEAAVQNADNKWALFCDTDYTNADKKLLLWVLHFTTLLIEHSFSRHLYSSMEHLLVLLASSNMSIVLGVLNLLYMFSKRSNFIVRLPVDKRACLISRLHNLAESWGGKENGFGLADCSNPNKSIPPSATTLHFEFHKEQASEESGKDQKDPKKQNMIYIHVEHVDKIHKTPAEIMKGLVSLYDVPSDKEMWLFTHVRLAHHFSDYHNRLFCVQARLQALSVLVYSNALQDATHTLLYNGLLDELVELIELKLPHLVEIRSAALRTLTSIIHLDRNPHFPKKPGSRLNSIIDVTGASHYHGFLPVLVRSCITSLTKDLNSQTVEIEIKHLSDSTSVEESSEENDVIEQDSGDDDEDEEDPMSSIQMPYYLEVGMHTHYVSDSDAPFPLPLATALFSFLYHLASYEAGGDALVSCGMMESLLQVINWHGVELEHITFVTRAVRVIDLITNIDMQAFHSHGGLQSFINRLDVEVNLCRKEQCYEFRPVCFEHNIDRAGPSCGDSDVAPVTFEFQYKPENCGKTCLPQRAALLKSMLNFLKKALQDSTFAENIRHLMEGTLPSSLKHIISNAEYYGPSLFLLATDVVTVYVFQEPSLLSTLQDNGLTDVVLHALLIKDVPATREVLGSLPNVFSALCLNTRGLSSFVKCKPFERLFKVLLSPNYLSAMRRRRSSDPLGDTASNLGNAMDELMRHQPSLKVDATAAIIKLLNELCQLGSDPKYICWRPHNKSEVTPTNSLRPSTNTEGSSDEEDDDEEEASTSSHNASSDTQVQTNSSSEKTPIALVDYILNVMKFIDAILSNNSTDDHCREFVSQGGLVPLLKILGLPNLPVDCPVTASAQAVASVCKSILNLAHEPKVLKQGLEQLNDVLKTLQPLYTHLTEPGGSKLLHELANAPHLESTFNTASATPLLHAMAAAHGYVLMFVHVCRTGQNDIRSLSLQHWGSEEGLAVLKGLAELYTSLVWESTLLLALCSDDVIPSDCDFGREDMEKLNIPLPSDRPENCNIDSAGNVASAMEALSTNPPPVTMEVDNENGSSNKPSSQQLKYIKPLLGASSRLGRALAELFGLLVKLCVGSPIRQRRGQNIITTPPLPSPYARNVATALNSLLANGLNWDRLPPSPVPKFRLTFLICSVGFTSPMLFDEKRYPYHLMLQRFVSLGGQMTFFNTFKMALSAGGTIPLEEGLEHPDLPEGTGEFLDAWLMLLEKMVNPKAILDSPHVISSKSNQGVYKAFAFDPLKYLVQIQKLAFEAIMYMWGKKPLPSYGVRMTESMLTILRHILRGEKILKERLSKLDENKTEGATASSTNSTSSSNTRTDIDVNHENLRQLMDMGFSREHALEALLHTLNVEQATDYLLANPPNLLRVSQSGMDVDMSEDDQVMHAIAISLGEPGPSTESNKKKEEVDDDSPLSEELIDTFTNQALLVCLELIELIPDCIYKACDLLVAIMKRNGPTFRDNVLDRLLTDIFTLADTMLTDCSNKEPTMDILQEIMTSKRALRLGYYTHLYTLFFEVPSYFDMRVPCGFAVHRANLIDIFIKLIGLAESVMTTFNKSNEPKWLTPILLLLDSVGKVATCTQRKRDMHECTKRDWKWFDLVTGKWTPYSTNTNRLINNAYWSGEQSIRVTCGRRRYTVTFSNMLQMNDESGNNRPICMTLVNLTDPCCTDFNIPVLPDMENTKVILTPEESEFCVPAPDLTFVQKQAIVRSCVKFMHLNIDKDLLHAVMRVCVRLTKDFANAKIFVQEGGIKCMLKMRQTSAFSGYGTLATVLIRHAFEEPQTLSYAIEKVMRGRTLLSIPPPYKELIYLCRQIGGAATRAPDVFLQVAKDILRVDTSIYRRLEELDTRLPLRTDPSARMDVPLIEEEVCIEVITDLLYALTQPLELPLPDIPADSDSTQNVEEIPSTSAPAVSRNSISLRATDLLNSSSSAELINLEHQDESITPILRVKLTRQSTFTLDVSKVEQELLKRPLLTKSAILKILADAVVSFGAIAKLITDFTYHADSCGDVITEDCSALSFIFDKILPDSENMSDRECSLTCRMLIAAIASCNHAPDAQLTLVNEVKAALVRALLMPESNEKHSQVQLICGIISTMIENCPPTAQTRVKTQNGHMNNIVRIMMRKGIFNDLARVSHCLDLSSPNFPHTVNASLKPMEALSRIINQPISTNASGGKYKKSQHNNAEEAQHSRTTSTEATNAQGEEAIEDTENTEHDISAVASSLEANPVNVAEEGDNVMDDIMMDQFLSHGNDGSNQSYNEVQSGRNHHSMDIDDETNIDYEHERDATEELMSTDSNDSDDASDQEVEDDENEDNEADDEDIDEGDDNDENNYDDENNTRSAPNVDRDEDILMIQYADHETENETLPRVIRWNENGFAIPIFDEASNSAEQTGPINHPLLISRHVSDTNMSTRAQRTNRARRYQYLQLNSRNPSNPPIILQRLLGPPHAHASSLPLGPSTVLGSHSQLRQDLNDSARVVVMDNFSLLPSTSEEQIDFVDQAGFLFGPSLAATLNHVPSVLHWWNEEAKILDVDSTYDCIAYICNQLIPTLLRHRNAEFIKMKQKKEKEEKAKSKKNQKSSPTENESALAAEFHDTATVDSDNWESELHIAEEDDIDGIPLDEYDRGEPPPPPPPTQNEQNQNTGQDSSVVEQHAIPVVHLPPHLANSQEDSGWISTEPSSRNPENTVDEVTQRTSDEQENIDFLNLQLQQLERSTFPFEIQDIRSLSVELPTENQPAEDNIMFPDGVFTSTPVERNDEQGSENDNLNRTFDVDNPFNFLTHHIPGIPSVLGEIRQVYLSPNPDQTGSSTINPPQVTDSSENQENVNQTASATLIPPQEGSESNNGGEGSSTPPDVIMTEHGRSSVDNEEIPEGVDPSFLEALPPEMRREVLEQHRILRLQQRISASTSSSTTDQAGTSASVDVINAEFLAALPPSLQEEVITQQRLEQQRQAAARTNPNEPVDAGAFFETLQPSLRTMILSDMEDSQMSALPPDLAAEAQTLRRDWEARNRQMVQERFLQSNFTIIRHSARSRVGSRYFTPSQSARDRLGFRYFTPPRAQWNSNVMPALNLSSNVRIRGRQLLDHESLSCLLVLLFADSPHLNKLRLHRVIRNLCYHGPTRDWIVKALLSIIDKSVHVKPDDRLNKPLRKMPKPGPLTSKLLTDSRNVSNGAIWLNIRMEAALGCHANVFIVNRASGKRTDRSNPSSVTIHPQAAPIICRNALDLFISLSKNFPLFLLPLKSKSDKDDKNKGAVSPTKNKIDSTDFWEMLLKLDSASAKKGKSLTKSHSLSLGSETENQNVSFEQSAFGQLLCMLSSPVIYRSTQLTDMLLRLLSVITLGMPELSKPPSSVKSTRSKTQKFESVSAPESALSLAVNVLTYKSCSEEGLEYVTTLLLNLSNCSLEMSYTILNLLLTGAMRIGEVVREQIQYMLNELKIYTIITRKRVLEDLNPSSSRGVLSNRFTKENVVITASTKVKTSCDLQLPAMAPLTSKTSSQIFFLRVLRVIVQIREAIKKRLRKDQYENDKKKRPKEEDETGSNVDDSSSNVDNSSQLSALSDQLYSLESLWDTLSQCLLELEHTPDHHAVLVLQPAVEAFFLVHSPQQGSTIEKPSTSNSGAQNQDASSSSSQNTNALRSSESLAHDFSAADNEILNMSDANSRSSVSPEQMKFLNFAEKHRTVLNQILRQTTAHLADGPFSVLVDHTRVLDFDVKRRYFRTELERLDQGIRREETAVHVRRSNIFEDSFRELYRRSPEEWKNRFYIVFEDEEGQDAGGLLREWYVIISRDIFNPMYALFTVSPGDRVTYMINPSSHYNTNHLCYFKFVGRVIAKAIYDNKLLECYFTRSFYKHILGIPVKYTDMENEDYSFYKGLVYLMDNNIKNLGLDLTFSTEVNEFGVTEVRDLIPNGRNVPVTEENKMEYIRLSCQMKMTGAIRQQLNAFLEGFYDIIPMRLISIFNEQELELLISGLPNVDIEDLRVNTEYHKYQVNSLQIQWFWRALRSFDQADRAKFLQFVTGTSKVPLQGFGALEGMNGVQKFQIHRDDRSTDRLPSAHTCFNQLDLPVYETYDKLRSYLLKAIHECSEGFGFA